MTKINLTKTKINVPNLGDHRICMSVAVLSLITGINSDIKNFETVNTSFHLLKNIKYLGENMKLKKYHKLIIACDGGAASGKTTGAKTNF